MSGIVQRGCRALKIVSAGEANKSIAQVFALKKEKYNEDNHNARCRKRGNQRPDDCRQRFGSSWLGLMYFNRDGFHRRRCIRLGGLGSGAAFISLVQFLVEVLEYIGCAFEHPCTAEKLAEI